MQHPGQGLIGAGYSCSRLSGYRPASGLPHAAALRAPGPPPLRGCAHAERVEEALGHGSRRNFEPAPATPGGQRIGVDVAAGQRHVAFRQPVEVAPALGKDPPQLLMIAQASFFPMI